MTLTMSTRQLVLLLVAVALVAVAVVVATVSLTGGAGGPESELFAKGNIPWAI